MKPTPETVNSYRTACGLSMCARTFASLGKWHDAHRCLDKAKEHWLKVEWQS
jgi:hypothetical protein